MLSAKTAAIGFASWAVPLLMVSLAVAQAPYFYRFDNDSGNFLWGTNNNWNVNGTGQANNFVPSAYYQEAALINLPGTVNVTTAQTQFSSSAASTLIAAAGLNVDGVTATGNGATLNIASGGSLSILVTYGTGITPPGPPGTLPTAGTGNATINNFGVITVQPGGTLTAKGDIIINSGSLTVGGAAAGGQLNAGNVRQAGTNSTLNVLGSANLNLTNGAVLNGNTTITGPNVVFNTPSVSMSNTTVFSPDVTSAAVPAGTGHSVINITGGLSLNGTIRPQFHNGVIPHLGDVWTLFDSAHVQGNFATSDATGAAPACRWGCDTRLPTRPPAAFTASKASSRSRISSPPKSIGPAVR